MAITGAVVGGYLGAGTAVSIGAGVAGGAILSGALGGTAPVTKAVTKGLGLTPKTPSAPQVQSLETPVKMPVADDVAVANARRRAITAQLSRSGRRSTILTDSLGGPSELLG